MLLHTALPDACIVRTILLFSLLLFFVLSSRAQDPSLEAVERSVEPLALAKSDGSFSDFISVLQENQHGDDKALLHRIFRLTHKRFLKKYVAYSEFKDVFSSGNYDCLTATTLFSQVLDQFQFKYSLIETNYHIFLVVHTTRGDVLLETTDKINGFITGDKTISTRIGEYSQNQLTSSAGSDQKIYVYHVNLCRQLLPAQLPGLLYFNQAIRLFNNKEWARSAEMLDKAGAIYDTPRVEELARILVRTVADHEQNTTKKKEIISLLRRYCVTRTVAGL